MPGHSFSIARVMALILIVGLNCAMVRATPSLVFQVPVFMFLIVALNLAAAMAAFGRPLRTFYFNFLFVGAIVTGVFTAFFFGETNAGPGSLIRAEIAIRRVLALPIQSSVFWTYSEFPIIAALDGPVSSLFGMIPALVAGVLAARWACRHDGELLRGISLFLRGALIGLGVVICVRLTLGFASAAESSQLRSCSWHWSVARFWADSSR